MTIDESRVSKTILHSLGEMMNDGLLVISESGEIKFVNDEFQMRVGNFDQNIEGDSIFTYLDSENEETLRNILKNLDEKSAVEMNWRSVAGDQLPSLTIASPVHSETGETDVCLLITHPPHITQVLEEGSSQQSFEGLLEMSPDGIAVVNRTGKVVYVNQVLLEQTGSSREEVIGKRFTKLQALRARDIPRYVKTFTDAIRGKIPEPFEVVWTDKDGNEFSSEVRMSAVRSNGKFIGLMSVARDITERKNAEEKYKTLFDTMTEGVVYQNSDGVIINANPAAERILGLTVEQMKGRDSIDPRWKAIRIDGSDFPGEKHPAMVALETGQPVKNALMGVYKPDLDDYTWISIDAVPLFREGETEPFQVYTTFKDVTEAKKNNDVILQSEEKYRQLFSLAPIGISLTHKDGRIIDFNNHMCELLGVYPDELGELNVGDFYDLPEARDILLQELLDSGSVRNTEVRMKRRDGSMLWTLINIDSIDYDGESVNFTTVREIGDLKEANIALQESEANFRSLFENTPNILALQKVLFDDKGQPIDFEFLQVNDAFLKQTGFSEEDVIGRKVTEVYPGIEAANVDWIQAVGAVVLSGETLKAEAFMEMYNRWYQVTTYNSKKNHVVTVFTDIHEMKLAEASLRAEKEKAETYLDIAGVMFLALDRQGNVTMVNKSGCELLGCIPEEIVGTNWFDEFLPPESSAELKEVHMKIVNGELEGVDTYVNSIRTRRGEDRIIEWRNTQLKNEDGSIFGVLSSGTDITDMSEAQKVIQTERDRALLYMDLMSHDIRNKLQAILGSAESILHVSENHVVEELASVVIDASERCSSIISKVKKTERLTSIPLERISLNAVLMQTVLDFNQVYSDVEINMNRAKAQAEIYADEFLDDMLYTLLENAVTYNHEDEKQVWVRLYEEHNGYAIVISDNGSGLTEEQKDVLFDIEKRIAGVGLHQVHHIVEKYNGQVSVSDRIEGKPTAGAEFRVWIPKANGS